MDVNVGYYYLDVVDVVLCGGPTTTTMRLEGDTILVRLVCFCSIFYAWMRLMGQ